MLLDIEFALFNFVGNSLESCKTMCLYVGTENTEQKSNAKEAGTQEITFLMKKSRSLQKTAIIRRLLITSRSQQITGSFLKHVAIRQPHLPTKEFL